MVANAVQEMKLKLRDPAVQIKKVLHLAYFNLIGVIEPNYAD